MKLRYFGHACVAVTSASGQLLVMDPPEPKYGYPLPPMEPDVVTVSHDHGDHCGLSALPHGGRVIRETGPVRVGDFLIEGAACFHDDRQGALRGSNRVYRVTVDGVALAHLGDLGHPLTHDLRSFLSGIDLLFCPVGGVFTIDAAQALAVIHAVRPGFAMPIHYRTEQGFLQQLDSLAEFLTLWDGPVLKWNPLWQSLPGGPAAETTLLAPDFQAGDGTRNG